MVRRRRKTVVDGFNNETDVCIGQDVNADQRFTPRLFKSHESYESIATTDDEATMCRYVHVARNPFDAFYSFYRFMPVYFGVDLDEVPIETFCDSLFNGSSHAGTLSKFYRSWYRTWKKHPKHVLWVFFEDLKTDLEAEVQRIGQWLGLEAGRSASKWKELLEVATKQAEFEFMKANVDKFNDGFVFQARKEALGLGHLEKPRIAKVRSGTTGSKKEVPQSVLDTLQRDWTEVMEKELGFSTYEEMKQAIKEQSG